MALASRRMHDDRRRSFVAAKRLDRENFGVELGGGLLPRRIRSSPRLAMQVRHHMPERKEELQCGAVFPVSDPDSDGIRIQSFSGSGYGIRIRVRIRIISGSRIVKIRVSTKMEKLRNFILS